MPGRSSFSQQTDEGKILALASNLRRLASFAYSDRSKKSLPTVSAFVSSSEAYLSQIPPQAGSDIGRVKEIFDRSIKNYHDAYQSSQERKRFAEYALTLSAMLSHRGDVRPS